MATPDSARVTVHNSFTVYYCICRSLLPKLDMLRTEAATRNPCVIALVETWLDSNILDKELCIPGYSIVRCDRNRKGGGILMYVKNSLSITSVTLNVSLELMFVDIHTRQGSLLLGLFYRPPSAPTTVIDDFNISLN